MSEEFAKSASTSDGFNWQCKACHSKRMKKRSAFNAVRDKVLVDQKRCSKCRDVKPADQFNRNRATSDGYCSLCRECEHKARVEREHHCVEKHTAGELVIEEQERICSCCKKQLPAVQFSINRRKRSGMKSTCKECDAKSHSKYKSRHEYRLKRLVASARDRARKYGLEFDLKHYYLTIPDVCPVLGIPIILDGDGRSDNSPSIDRIRNDVGYIDGNVVVVSSRANRLKSDATVSEMLALAQYYEGSLS